MKDKYMIITLNDYLALIPPTFEGNKIRECLRRIENENKILRSFEYKGEHYFTVEA